MHDPRIRRQVVSERMADEAMRATACKKEVSSAKRPFLPGDDVVYTTHGVGRVLDVSVETIAGHAVEIIRVSFPKERLTLRIPKATAHGSGLRHVFATHFLDQLLDILRENPRRGHTIWARRSEALRLELATGDVFRVAGVLRDLRHRASRDEGSFSEREIFETALGRLAAEVRLAMKIDEVSAAAMLTSIMQEANASMTVNAPSDEKRSHARSSVTGAARPRDNHPPSTNSTDAST